MQHDFFGNALARTRRANRKMKHAKTICALTLIAGAHRLEAVRGLGWEKVPATILNISDVEARLIGWWVSLKLPPSTLRNLRSRLANRVQLTSDGHRAYLDAVEGAFGGDVDMRSSSSFYGNAPEAAKGRYSPAECTGAKKVPVEGNPDPKHISTSYSERQNLTMRMHMRRFTRLTNAFSKKVENHAYAVALHMMYYNFVRIPSEAAGDAGDGGGRVEQVVGDRRHCEAGRRCRRAGWETRAV